MHRLHRLRQFAAFALLLFWSIWIFDRVTAWPSVSTNERLLAPVSSYPLEWGSGSAHLNAASWRDDGRLTFFGVDDAVITDPRFFNSWYGGFWEVGISHSAAATGGPPFINQVMRQYTSPTE